MRLWGSFVMVANALPTKAFHQGVAPQASEVFCADAGLKQSSEA
jgi:hypothetical protein